MKSRWTSFLVGIVAVSLLILTTVRLSHKTSAQINPVVIAPGFEFNIFADPTRVEEFALSYYSGPVSMAFDARGRLFVGTYSGKILILLDNNDDGIVDQVKTFASGVSLPLGLTFRANGDLFATSNVLRGTGSIVRLRDTDGDDVADERTTIISGLPSEGDHQTDRLRFGPDGLLYFGQGSSTDNGLPKPGFPGERALNAAILRADVDNPGAIDTFATGLRNPFGMAFHPETGQLFATDGGSGELGLGGEDLSPPEEVNWVVQGGNYGFPLCEGTPSAGRDGCAGVRAPSIQYPRHLTPTSLAFYTGPQALEFRNHLLLTLYKDLPNIQNYGGDLRRMIVEGDGSNGIRLIDDGFIVQLNPIDPFDGPLDTAIDPISGDIYVARFDPVDHRDDNEHHHFIYRVHRSGSDATPFIGPPRPQAVMAGSGAATINLVGRHLKPGAVVLADGVSVTTRPGASIFDLVFDLPTSNTSTARTIQLEVRNPDGARSNPQTFSVTTGPIDPPPDKSPVIVGLQVKKKKKIIETVTSGSKAKKLTLLVTGTDFDGGVQLLVNGSPLELLSSSPTELTAKFTKPMVAAPGELIIQVRNSSGKVSNTMRLVVVAAQ